MQFHGRGFEMLATLMQHCCPDTVTNSFSSLLSLLNDVQGESESIIKYQSRFDGLTIELARCKVVIPSLLLVMLFLHALHGRYSTIVKQFCTRFKPIEEATLDSIVSDVIYNDGFHTVEHSKKGEPGSTPPWYHMPATSAANTNSDRNGKVWQTPLEWLAKYGEKGIKSRWMWALVGTGICPICHWDVLPRHVPAQCPLLAELNLKLISSPPAAATSAPGPAPSPAPAPTHGGRAAAADASSTSGCSFSSAPPSGLTAALAPSPSSAGDYEPDEDYHWDGDDLGVEYVAPPKLNKRVVLYSPSYSHVSIVSSSSTLALSSRLGQRPPCLLSALQRLLTSFLVSPVALPLSYGQLTVVDTGATDHMVPDKSCFISYTSISALSVRMGNNSYVLVLCCGTDIFALNSKRILVRNVLHFPV
jgi:hypothetical protein